jgi:AmiR/NasT family two-component response regulator
MERDVEAHLASLELENEQLRTALTSRIVIEQAKGVLSVVLDMPIEGAFEVLRSQARSTRRLIHDVAREVVDTKGGCLADWTR